MDKCKLNDNTFFKNVDEIISEKSKFILEDLNCQFNTNSNEPDIQATSLIKKSKFEELMLLDSVNESSQQPLSKLQSELLIFHNLNDAKSHEFWIKHGQQIPHLDACYKHLKSVSPTNCAIERMFSQSNMTLNDLRHKLSIETIENILFLKYPCPF